MRHTLSAAIIGALVLSLAACGNGHLSRANAKAQIEQFVKQSQGPNPRSPHTLLVKIGTVANCKPDRYSSDNDPIERSVETTELSATGYLTVVPIKKHVWNVELTELGKRSIEDEKYAHEQIGDCDQWQVTIPLVKYDHFDVTGVMEEGVHAKVDMTVTFVVLPVGLAVRKIAPAIKLAIDTKTYGGDLAHQFALTDPTGGLPDDLFLDLNKDRYVKHGSITFNKYDDGWKLDEHSAKEEK